uniref:F-box associated domain-containing protein n=1 Tax=Acrobeloides nanus TaxID=290746 RepID=A0A914EKC0_9BILA
MTIVKIRSPKEMLKGKLNKIGFRDHELFVSPTRDDVIEIWSVHCLIPNSWQCLCRIAFVEIPYVKYAMNISGDKIYVLIIGMKDPGDVFRVWLFEVSSLDGTYNSYTLDEDSFQAFDEVYLDNIYIGCGQNTLYMYDRSLVMGEIPFYNFILHEEINTFSIERKPIRVPKEERQWTRFPIVLDGDKRTVLKLSDTNEVFVYDGSIDTWTRIFANEESDLKLEEMRSARGISETYGPRGHRFSAIESPLTVYADHGCCIFKVHNRGLHSFYDFSINFNNRTYKLLKVSAVRLGPLVEQRNYMLCTPTKLAFICPDLVAFVPIQLPTLRELSFWKIQENYAKQDKNGIWVGGRSEQQIRDLCNLKHHNRIV